MKKRTRLFVSMTILLPLMAYAFLGFGRPNENISSKFVENAPAKIQKAAKSLNAMALPENYEVFAGVMRNTGSGWYLITSGNHSALNIDSITSNTQSIKVHIEGMNASDVTTMLIAPDETYAGVYHFGSSLGLDAGIVLVKKLERSKISTLITHTGNGNFTHNAGGTSSVTYDTTDGVMRITHAAAKGHDAVFSWMNRNDGEITVAKAVGSSEFTTYREYKFYNLDGTQKTLSDPEMYRFYWTRSKEIRDITGMTQNPNWVSSSTGNVWIIGVMKV